MAKFDDISLFGPRKEAAPKAASSASEELSEVADSLGEALAPLVIDFHESAQEWFEAGDFASPIAVDLTEHASIRKEGKVWEVTVIREGLSLNGRYYPREVLEESIPVWEGVDVCMYGWDPHRDRGHVPQAVEGVFPSGTYANKVGFIRKVRGQEVNGRYELIAEFVCIREELRRELIETMEGQGKMPGFSIHARGESVPQFHQGRKVVVITKILETKELTLVSRPAAGGRGLRIVAGQQNTTEVEMNLTKIRAYVASKSPAAMSSLLEAMEPGPLIESAAQLLKEMNGASDLVELALDFLKDGKMEEAIKVLERMIGKADAEMPTPEDEPMPEASTAVEARKMSMLDARLAEADAKLANLSLMECRSILENSIKKAKLDDFVEEELRTKFNGKIFTEAELEKEIAYARRLMSVNAGGEAKIERATEGRSPRVEVLFESTDNFQMGMNLMMGYIPPDNLTESEKSQYKALQSDGRFLRPRRLYEFATGDYNCSKIGMPISALGNNLTEAATTTTYSNALTNSINLVLVQKWERQGQNLWNGLINETSTDNLYQQDRVIQGGTDRLPQVAEGGTYVDLGDPETYSVGYSLSKYGGIRDITEECIIQDRIGIFQNIPKDLAEAAFETLETFGWDLLTGWNGTAINGATSYDTVAHYHANHHNTGVSALAHASFVDARAALRETKRFSYATALNDATDVNTSDIAFVVDDATGFKEGTYFAIDAEICRVTGISGNTLTVVRAQLGTTAAAHVDDTPIYAFGGNIRLDVNGPGQGPNLILVVPTQLEATGLEILNSERVPGGDTNNYNFLRPQYQDGRIQLRAVGSNYLRDQNNWFLCTPAENTPGLEISYFNNQRVPQVINRTDEQVGVMFTNDRMQFKPKFRFGGKALFHQGRYAGIVTGG